MGRGASVDRAHEAGDDHEGRLVSVGARQGRQRVVWGARPWPQVAGHELGPQAVGLLRFAVPEVEVGLLDPRRWGQLELGHLDVVEVEHDLDVAGLARQRAEQIAEVDVLRRGAPEAEGVRAAHLAVAGGGREDPLVSQVGAVELLERQRRGHLLR